MLTEVKYVRRQTTNVEEGYNSQLKKSFNMIRIKQEI